MSGFGAWHPLTPSWVPGATAIWAVTALSCVCNYCRRYPTSGKCALVCGYAYWCTDCASFSVVRCAWVHCRMRPHQRERALVCGHVAVGKVALSLSVVWCSCSLPTVFPSLPFWWQAARVGARIWLFGQVSASLHVVLVLVCSLPCWCADTTM